jgi:large subunit ribosomal protein L18
MSDYRGKRLKRQQGRRRRARFRIRSRIHGTAERPRLAVKKSLRYIYAQLINDELGVTLAQANSDEQDVRSKLEEASTGSAAAARLVGELIGRRAKDKGVEEVVFDRGGYIYHGKVKEVAEGARSQDLKF